LFGECGTAIFHDRGFYLFGEVLMAARPTLNEEALEVLQEMGWGHFKGFAVFSHVAETRMMHNRNQLVVIERLCGQEIGDFSCYSWKIFKHLLISNEEDIRAALGFLPPPGHMVGPRGPPHPLQVAEPFHGLGKPQPERPEIGPEIVQAACETIQRMPGDVEVSGLMAIGTELDREMRFEYSISRATPNFRS
jgi:hypothetical protein